ncbi:Gfo/Idh/MocA family protein [Serinibacter arcticus]|uniref:Oxidoreductase domain protein n=1 Tax=Serinibacter arcticus TaxID=1655435 RepID=A0A4Z1E1M3_9MICO|nr:Gfo/Idh/MocA family oxidoreductase [Serinibacter arcticus]TGO05129.1 oxidoreductase domain protein [Serinibacter arcticus]
MTPTAAAATPATPPAAGPARFAVVGSGWRAAFFLRVARQLPERFAVTGVVSRSAERGAEVERAWGVPTWRTVAEALAADRPDFAVVSVPHEVAPGVIRELVSRDVPVLSETPPAPDVPALRELWAAVGGSGLVQVAEHSPFMPAHAARVEAVRRGLIGTPGSVQISSTHGYHAVAVIRALLGVGFEDVAVSAHVSTAPLVDVMNRQGWTDDDEPRDAETTLATLGFASGRSALYDFTDNQWHNPLRTNRIVVRGSRGEMVDDRVVRLAGPRTVVESRLARRQAGIEQDLEGFDLDHLSLDGEVLFRNPFQGARLADDEIAVASLLGATAAWVAGAGPAPYPLAEASQDHLISLAMTEAARSGSVVRTGTEDWAG